jgi:uncharacterized protein (DUF849 family)
MAKVIITAAITGGIHTPTMSPYLPYKPQDIADQAVGAAEAGAAVVHIHARDPENGQPSPRLELYEQIIESIRSRSNVLICITTGGGAGQTVEQRVAVIPRFKPELASFNMGSLNFGLHPMLDRYKDFQHPWEKEMLEFSRSWVFTNTFADLEKICGIFRENGTKPELEVYDTGHLYNIRYLLDKGFLKKPIYMQFVMGILGGIGATPYDLMNLHTTAERLFGGDYKWSVIGAGRNQFRQCTMGAIMGGNVRVGLEDNLFLSKGELATSNAAQVTKIRKVLEELGMETASPDDTRGILNIGNAW